jgi:16S rRNA (uracil1498-N3)-methyltransferase
MRHIRIYQPGSYEDKDSVELSPDAALHVGVVLRMQVGETLTLFCGDNREFSATITHVHKKKVVVVITDVQIVNRESPCFIHLAQAISKGDRMEFVVQKAVELGVASITPIITARCVVRLDADRLAKKQLQWQAIAIAACEQSGRNQVPIVYPACSLEQYLQTTEIKTKLMLHPTAQKSQRDTAMSDAQIALIIGPEGGLSEEEVLFAQTKGATALSLGPRILRTETAALAAISVIQSVYGDL